MYLYLRILAVFILTARSNAQDEAGFNVTSDTTDVKGGNPVIFEIHNNKKPDEVDTRSSETESKNQDEEKSDKQSKDENIKTGQGIVPESMANYTRSEDKTSEINDQKSSEVSSIEYRRTLNDNLEINTDDSSGENDQKHDSVSELNLQSENAEDSVDDVEKTTSDKEKFSNDNVSVEGKRDSLEDITINLEPLNDPLRETRRMLFGSPDVIDTKSRSDEDAALEVIRVESPVESQDAPISFSKLNQFGSRWNYAGDLIASHVQPAVAPAVTYNPGLLHIPTATFTPQTFNKLGSIENDQAQFMRNVKNSRATGSTSIESKHIEYYNSIESANAYPYVPTGKPNFTPQSFSYDAFPRLGKATMVSPIKFPNYYKPYDSSYNTKIYNPFELPQDKNFRHYYHQPLLQ